MAPHRSSLQCGTVLLVPRGELTEHEDGGRRTDRVTPDRDLSEFLLRACHDLKSAARGIRAHAELLRRDHRPDTSDFEQRVDFIVDGARRIDSITDGLSGYSIALQIQEASFQFVSMNALLRTVLARLGEELRESGAEVACGELPRISGNPDRLVQVFEILLRNALRHRAERPPRINVTAEKQDEEWLFTVRDNGPGIDAAFLERIFKPFERLYTTESQGAGMGLAICRAIVERHGGKLWAESQTGAGSTFFFSLPAIGQ
jgi:chemotaxis family two-component system sensor kinase Cph1